MSNLSSQPPNTGGDKPRRYFLYRALSVGAVVYPRPQGLECRTCFKSEPQNIEQEISNDEVWNRFALTISD
jgi:hypothetical protein